MINGCLCGFSSFLLQKSMKFQFTYSFAFVSLKDASHNAFLSIEFTIKWTKSCLGLQQFSIRLTQRCHDQIISLRRSYSSPLSPCNKDFYMNTYAPQRGSIYSMALCFDCYYKYTYTYTYIWPTHTRQKKTYLILLKGMYKYMHICVCIFIYVCVCASLISRNLY